MLGIVLCLQDKTKFVLHTSRGPSRHHITSQVMTDAVQGEVMGSEGQGELASAIIDMLVSEGLLDEVPLCRQKVRCAHSYGRVISARRTRRRR